MKDFIGWVRNLTVELKKPAEEQEGFVRGITATLQGLKSTFETIGEIVDGIVSAMNYFVEASEKVTGIMFAPAQTPIVSPDELQNVIGMMTGASSGNGPSMFDRAASLFGGGDEAGGGAWQG